MRFSSLSLLVPGLLALPSHAQYHQAPAPAGLGAPISAYDRIYTSDQTSNTITVINPSNNTVLGTIALGSTRLNDVIGPQYIQSVNAHGLGFSRDGKYIVSLSVTSNTVTVIKTVDNTIVSKTYVDRNPHEAFFAPDNRTIWIGTRGVDSIEIIDGLGGNFIARIPSYGGPSKVLFSPDGSTAYVNHIRAGYVDVLDVASRTHIANITGLAHVFSSDMGLSADGKRLWVAHKMTGQISVISTASRRIVTVLATGAETNHPQFADINGTTYGFVTVGSLNHTKVYRQEDSEKPPVYVGTIQSTGVQPHGLWPSADNTRMYVLNEHSDSVDVIDLTSFPFPVIETLDVGQEGQALIYVSNAVLTGSGLQGLGTQGLNSKTRPKNVLLNVQEKRTNSTISSHEKVPATALINVRQVNGLDMVKVIGRHLKLNTTYTVTADSEKYGAKELPLLEFKASTTSLTGCSGGAPQVLGFMKFDGVYESESLKVLEGNV